MITVLWHVLWLQDAYLKGRKGSPPTWFTIVTIFIDVFSIGCMILGYNG